MELAGSIACHKLSLKFCPDFQLAVLAICDCLLPAAVVRKQAHPTAKHTNGFMAVTAVLSVAALRPRPCSHDCNEPHLQ